MARTVGIGKQDFEDIITNNTFYIDKTHFIKEWWENQDSVTLITRPRRFGKTLTLNMVERFFSIKHSGNSGLFQNLSVWKEEKYRALQGTYPVISLSFANVKESNLANTIQRINQIITNVYYENRFLLDSDILSPEEKREFQKVSIDMPDVISTMALHNLSLYLMRYYKRKVIILLDEYDTPMQEAYINGYWNELTSFTRSLFNCTFKTNPYLERGLMTGITRISKESVFSDLNNLTVITTTSDAYSNCFGFTEKEVISALKEYGLSEKLNEVRNWYDGFAFGRLSNIYNPWSITNYLKYTQFSTYWANTSSNSLISRLLCQSIRSVKITFESLLQGKSLEMSLDEQVVFSQLDSREGAVWSLLLASGYLKVNDFFQNERGQRQYILSITNYEVHLMFEDMIHDWFSEYDESYNDFIAALLSDDLEAMNEYMNQVALSTFSFFDTGKSPSGKSEPERFYHDFVLGLLVDLAPKYSITSNRESGFGRYDVLLEPKNKDMDAIIIEFKVRNPKKEKTLEDTLESAARQINEKKYAASLEAQGIPPHKIRKYGFAFEGKTVLIQSF